MLRSSATARATASERLSAAASPNLTPTLWFVLAVAVLGHLMTHGMYDRMVKAFTWIPPVVRGLLLVGLALFIKQVASFEVQPFIYFKF